MYESSPTILWPMVTVLKYLNFVEKVQLIQLINVCFVIPPFDVFKLFHFFLIGIKVRTRCSESLMHHKFAIVDNELLINGSFNWTEQATFGNWENVIITTVPVKMVKSYVDHFEVLWLKLNAGA